MKDKTFEEEQLLLFSEIVESLGDDASDEQYAVAFLEFVLQSERLRRGVTIPSPEQEAVDRETLERLTNAEIADPVYSLAEAFFRRIAKDPNKAMRYLVKHGEARSAEQSRRASKERKSRQDSITQKIDEMVGKNPAISAREVVWALKRDEDFSVSDSEIRCLNDHSVSTRDAIRGRLSRSKQRFKKKDSR